jgi:hypothetical protein
MRSEGSSKSSPWAVRVAIRRIAIWVGQPVFTEQLRQQRKEFLRNCGGVSYPIGGVRNDEVVSCPGPKAVAIAPLYWLRTRMSSVHANPFTDCAAHCVG